MNGTIQVTVIATGFNVDTSCEKSNFASLEKAINEIARRINRSGFGVFPKTRRQG
ncbi:MAG: hypothetical protein GF344_06855 [Chitinivibrionales bacterium]|nr:hypothetical protein [Chitinivibrionales bacterium]